MANKKILLGMLVMVLVFGIMVVGCDTDSTFGDYTFEFRVQNSVGISEIEKVEFYNGSSTSAPLLHTEVVNLLQGQMSRTIRISGFTERQGENARIYGVRVITPAGNSHFAFSSAENNAKIHASASALFWVILFFRGNW